MLNRRSAAKPHIGGNIRCSQYYWVRSGDQLCRYGAAAALFVEWESLRMEVSWTQHSEHK